MTRSNFVSKRTSPLSFLALNNCPYGADCVTLVRWPYLASSERFWNKAEGAGDGSGVGLGAGAVGGL